VVFKGTGSPVTPGGFRKNTVELEIWRYFPYNKIHGVDRNFADRPGPHLIVSPQEEFDEKRKGKIESDTVLFSEAA
jgi:hypothetical protein